ncbi:MAG: sodium ion-translocating decarboxylase subunit beta [Clostridiales bacterium]|nr:sodium ion-translocating decarboxylase subunit beta [Clostridiales bacterium]
MLFINRLFEIFSGLLADSGFLLLFQGDGYKYIIMICVAIFFMYLAIVKKYEPLLLLPIAFGMLLANLPGAGLMAEPTEDAVGGLLYYLYQGDALGIFPPLIFLGVGVMTDFGPLIANPTALLLGATAQLGIFIAFLGALALGMSPQEAASIGIIGGADGPTAIYTTTKLAPHILSTVAVAAYSYMALIPIIQPPIMKLLTTKKERAVKMEQLRPVSKTEKIIFPVMVSILVILILPSTASLIGMLMLGNLLKVCGVTEKIANHASEALMHILSLFIGISVGATTDAATFLTADTLKIVILGLFAFMVSTAGGVLLGKVMYKLSGGKINPLIGAAGVSAVPMAARVAQNVGKEENPNNYLLMHAMGPNVAGVIGSAVASGIFLAIFQ